MNMATRNARIILELQVDTQDKPESFQPWLLFQTILEQLRKEYGIDHTIIKGTEDN